MSGEDSDVSRIAGTPHACLPPAGFSVYYYRSLSLSSQSRYIRPMPTPPKKLRKQYTNTEHPLVILRFEDGHEIQVAKGGGKSFDAYSGETIKVLAVYDRTSGERELVESKRADEFADA